MACVLTHSHPPQQQGEMGGTGGRCLVHALLIIRVDSHMTRGIYTPYTTGLGRAYLKHIHQLVGAQVHPCDPLNEGDGGEQHA